MFWKNNKGFKTEAELQKYIDKKINSTLNTVFNSAVGNVRNIINGNNGQAQAKINKLEERIVHLEKYLGIEFGTETTTGYKKVKNSKKK